VVHGGEAFAAPVRLDDAVLAALDALVPLAPLHQPHNLVPIRALAARRPDLIQVACFDTAFHRTIPEVAQSFALPAAVTDKGVRRYGFHGLSYAYIASVLPAVDPHAAPVRAAVCRAAAWLGVALDEAANAAHGPRISTAESRTAAWVIPTDEELMIARQTLDAVRTDGAAAG